MSLLHGGPRVRNGQHHDRGRGVRSHCVSGEGRSGPEAAATCRHPRAAVSGSPWGWHTACVGCGGTFRRWPARAEQGGRTRAGVWRRPGRCRRDQKSNRCPGGKRGAREEARRSSRLLNDARTGAGKLKAAVKSSYRRVPGAWVVGLDRSADRAVAGARAACRMCRSPGGAYPQRLRCAVCARRPADDGDRRDRDEGPTADHPASLLAPAPAPAPGKCVLLRWTGSSRGRPAA